MSLILEHIHCRKCRIPIRDRGCLIYQHPKTSCENSGKVWFSGSVEVEWFSSEVQEQWIEA